MSARRWSLDVEVLVVSEFATRNNIQKSSASAGYFRIPAGLPRGADESADIVSGPGYDRHGRPVLDRARARFGAGGRSRARAPRTPPAPPPAYPPDADTTTVRSYCFVLVHLREPAKPVLFLLDDRQPERQDQSCRVLGGMRDARSGRRSHGGRDHNVGPAPPQRCRARSAGGRRAAALPRAVGRWPRVGVLPRP